MEVLPVLGACFRCGLVCITQFKNNPTNPVLATCYDGALEARLPPQVDFGAEDTRGLCMV